MRLMTFNIRVCNYGKQIGQAAKEIAAFAPDLLCLQELDRGVFRSAGLDVPRLLARKLRMHYRFFPSLSLGLGKYGIAIFSVSPLRETRVIPLESGELEPRIMARARITLEGRDVTVLNTHLSYEDSAVRKTQMAFVREAFSQEECCILMGDFNADSFAEYGAWPPEQCLNSAQTPFPTAVGAFGRGSFACIDNILLSPDMRFTHREMGVSHVSDHNPLFAQAVFL